MLYEVITIVGHLGQTIDVGLTGAEVAAFDGVVEQTEDVITSYSIHYTKLYDSISGTDQPLADFSITVKSNGSIFTHDRILVG